MRTNWTLSLPVMIMLVITPALAADHLMIHIRRSSDTSACSSTDSELTMEFNQARTELLAQQRFLLPYASATHRFMAGIDQNDLRRRLQQIPTSIFSFNSINTDENFIASVNNESITERTAADLDVNLRNIWISLYNDYVRENSELFSNLDCDMSNGFQFRCSRPLQSWQGLTFMAMFPSKNPRDFRFQIEPTYKDPSERIFWQLIGYFDSNGRPQIEMLIEAHPLGMNLGMYWNLEPPHLEFSIHSPTALGQYIRARRSSPLCATTQVSPLMDAGLAEEHR